MHLRMPEAVLGWGLPANINTGTRYIQGEPQEDHSMHLQMPEAVLGWSLPAYYKPWYRLDPGCTSEAPLRDGTKKH